MNKEKILFELECLRDNITDNNFKDILNNAIDCIEEKDKVIDEILNHPFFTNDCPYTSIDDEDNKILKLCDCDNCEEDYEKCWLKYFENEILERGKK